MPSNDPAADSSSPPRQRQSPLPFGSFWTIRSCDRVVTEYSWTAVAERMEVEYRAIVDDFRPRA